MSRPALLLFTTLAFPAVGCGSGRLDSRDAGRDTGVGDQRPVDAARDSGTDTLADAAPDAAVLMGRHAFDVTVGLTVMPSQSSPGGFNSFPTSARATLVVDASAGWLLIGGVGQGSAAMATNTGDSLTIATPVTLGVPFASACDGQATLHFATLDVTVDNGGRLHGTGAGLASYITGDVGSNQAFTATLDGLPDVTPPSLPLGTAGTLDPLAPARFAASEPLPVGTKAQLVAADGSVVDLSPEVSPAASPAFITAFRVPFTLSFGVSYHLALDQMVDFAGNHALPPQTPPLVTPAAPALLTDGGFEATTGMDGQLISSTGDLPVISGSKSFYLDPGVGQGAAVSFRLAVHPGDGAVRFSYRVASMVQYGSFYGAIVIGSAGSTITSLSQLPLGTPTTTVTRATGGTLTVGPVATVELALPDPSASEVVLKISSASSGCGLAPPRAGLIIDDVVVGG